MGKSTRSTTLTTKDSSSPTMTGTDKSTNGALRLSLVSKKSFFANTQDTSKTQIVRSSRSYLPKNQEPHCSMEIVLRTNGLQGQSQLGSLLGFEKVKTFSLHYLSLW